MQRSGIVQGGFRYRLGRVKACTEHCTGFRLLLTACCLLLSRLTEQLEAKLQQLGGGGGASASTSALHGASTNGGGALVTVVAPHAVNNAQPLLLQPGAATAAAVPFQGAPFAPSPSDLPSQSEAGPSMMDHLQHLLADKDEEEEDDDDDEVERLVCTNEGCQAERDELTQVCHNCRHAAWSGMTAGLDHDGRPGPWRPDNLGNDEVHTANPNPNPNPDPKP